MAIKDGRFVAAGSNNSIRGLAGERTEVVDLEGATVLPGFNDSHVHFASAGHLLLGINLLDANDDDLFVRAKIEVFILRHPLSI